VVDTAAGIAILWRARYSRASTLLTERPAMFRQHALEHRVTRAFGVPCGQFELARIAASTVFDDGQG